MSKNLKTILIIFTIVLLTGIGFLIGRGQAGLPEKTVPFSITVNPSGNYTITIAPADQICTKGQVLTFAIVAVPSGGFDADVQLTVGGLPAGSFSFSRAVLTAGSYTSTLTVNTTTLDSNSVYSCNLTAKDI